MPISSRSFNTFFTHFLHFSYIFTFFVFSAYFFIFFRVKSFFRFTFTLSSTLPSIKKRKKKANFFSCQAYCQVSFFSEIYPVFRS